MISLRVLILIFGLQLDRRPDECFFRRDQPEENRRIRAILPLAFQSYLWLAPELMIVWSVLPE
jgi:hypothetical protein